MGSFKGLKQVRRIVEDCIQNKMHPVYHIKVKGLALCFYCNWCFLLKTCQLSYLHLKIYQHSQSLFISSLQTFSFLFRFLWWRKSLKRIQRLQTKTGIDFFQNSKSMASTTHFLLYMDKITFFQFILSNIFPIF